jgi:DNA-binding HxlR family transcriptional regulator
VPLGGDYARQDCSLARALELVGERWTLLVVRDCFLGVRRFSDFQVHLDISKAVLSRRLADLVEAGLLTHDAVTRDYALTDAGLALWPTVLTLAQWGDQQRPADGPRRLFLHAGCDGRLGAGGRCLRCDATPAPYDVTTRPGPGADPTVRDDHVSVSLREPKRLLEPLGAQREV